MNEFRVSDQKQVLYLLWLISLLAFLFLSYNVSSISGSSDLYSLIVLIIVFFGGGVFVLLAIVAIADLFRKSERRSGLNYILLTMLTVGGFAGCIYFFAEFPQPPHANTEKIIEEYRLPALMESDVFNAVNDERRKADMMELTRDFKLDEAALKKSEDMCEKQYWSHDSSDGMEPWDWIKAEKYSYDAAGENLARDFLNTSNMVQSWMSSPTHKANILDSRFTRTGVAIKECTLQGTRTQLVVQMFARPRSTVTKSATGNDQGTFTNNPDEPIHCPMNVECGGGTRPLKRSECEASTCCQMRDQSWVFYIDRNKCLQDQKDGK